MCAAFGLSVIAAQEGGASLLSWALMLLSGFGAGFSLSLTLPRQVTTGRAFAFGCVGAILFVPILTNLLRLWPGLADALYAPGFRDVLDDLSHGRNPWA